MVRSRLMLLLIGAAVLFAFNTHAEEGQGGQAGQDGHRRVRGRRDGDRRRDDRRRDDDRRPDGVAENNDKAGIATGVLVSKGDAWIEVRLDGGDKTQKYIPQWTGGTPEQGGGPDKAMLAKIATLKVNTRIGLSWKQDEHLRVVEIRPADGSQKDGGGDQNAEHKDAEHKDGEHKDGEHHENRDR